jgi:hypothetical protein
MQHLVGSGTLVLYIGRKILKGQETKNCDKQGNWAARPIFQNQDFPNRGKADLLLFIRKIILYYIFLIIQEPTRYNSVEITTRCSL